MPKAEGFFNYRPDILTDQGTRKPAGFTGNTITGEVPMAEWDEPHQAYRLIESAPSYRTTEVNPRVTDDASTNATSEYVEPEDPTAKKSKIGVYLIPVIIGLIIVFIIMKVVKRG